MNRTIAGAAWVVGGLTLALAGGCRSAAPPKKAITVLPQVSLIQPEKRTIKRAVGQPGYIYAYEQTSLYPKVSGFIQKWYVDIGDRIEAGQDLCDIYVPELHAELRQKIAQLTLQQENVKVAEQMVDVAAHRLAMASAKTKEMRAYVGKYGADVERSESEYKRLASLQGDRVVAPQIIIEAKKQLQADTASREAALSSVQAAEATELAQAADLAKAKIDVKAAQAKVLVQKADKERLEALVSYTHLTAPYDGIVVLRNANKGDYVQPATGDMSATSPSWDESTNRGAPIYVVASTNMVRIYVDVPEGQAIYVNAKTPATVLIPALSGEEISAPITRTSWSLNVRSRTLRAEVDLPNQDARLLPGMYAYGEVLINRPNVWALPLECVVMLGNQTVCYRDENGKAVLTPLQTGLDDGKWIEVVRIQVGGRWQSITGNEPVIKGDLGELSNNRAVEVVKNPAAQEQPQSR